MNDRRGVWFVAKNMISPPKKEKENHNFYYNSPECDQERESNGYIWNWHTIILFVNLCKGCEFICSNRKTPFIGIRAFLI